MNIGFVKYNKNRQVSNRNINSILKELKYYYFSLINKVEQNKYKKNIYSVYNTSDKSIQKLIKKLQKEKVQYIIPETGLEIDYPKLTGKCLIKSMIPEIVDYCYQATTPRLDEVHICTNIFNSDNIKIIEELINKVKVVNIVTNNKNYYRLERRMEEKNIFITVSSNRRKSLKNASIVVNLDLENFDEYNINRNMIVIDITQKIELPNGFNGIVIRKINVNTKKIMRIFSEFENFDRNYLIESEIIRINDYENIRKYISFNKMYIEKFFNEKLIDKDEFYRIKDFNLKECKKIKQKINTKSIKNKKVPPQPTGVGQGGG